MKPIDNEVERDQETKKMFFNLFVFHSYIIIFLFLFICPKSSIVVFFFKKEIFSLSFIILIRLLQQQHTQNDSKS
jgi:hypothetical protein